MHLWPGEGTEKASAKGPYKSLRTEQSSVLVLAPKYETCKIKSQQMLNPVLVKSNLRLDLFSLYNNSLFCTYLNSLFVTK